MRRASVSLIRLCCLLMLPLLVLSSVHAESKAPEIQLDLSDTTGHVLLDRLFEIRYAPENWNGIILRVRGQYYAEETAEGLRHSLIVTDCLDHCSEIAFQLIPSEESEIVWPEINQEVGIVAQIEAYATDYGSRARLVVLSLND